MGLDQFDALVAAFPHSHYVQDWNLMVWRPIGLLDDALADRVVEFVEAEERDMPFDRFSDLTALTHIHLKIGHVFEIARRRREFYAGERPAKSAFYCDKTVGFGIARMFEALMTGTDIEVRAFRKRSDAADWLGVPDSILVPLDP